MSNKTKSITEIIEMLDYSINKARKLRNISEAVVALGNIDEPHARETLANALSKQIDDAAWGVRLACDYIDQLEEALSKEVLTIDEEATEDDLPFVTPGEEVEA